MRYNHILIYIYENAQDLKAAEYARSLNRFALFI